MKSIQLNVPSKLSEIKLSDYVKYQKVLDVNQEDEYSEVFVQQKCLEIFCGIPLMDAIKYKVTDVRKAVGIIHNTLNTQPDLVREIKIGDLELGFIPKLDDMTFGEYVDLDTSLGKWEDMYKVMAVLYRPIKQRSGKKYIIEDYKGDRYWDAMMNCPMDAVVGSMVFFWNLGNELSKAMTTYLEEEVAGDLTVNQISQLNGDGINPFKHLLNTTLLK
jgi:hypothetical protein